MTQTPQDFTKFASDLGYDTQEKLAHSMRLLKAVIDHDGGAGSFDKMAEDQVSYFAPLWMMFEKTAEKAGADLPSCDVDQVVDAFVTYVKEAAEEAKKDDKDDKDKEKKEEEENQKKASAHFQKLAYESSMESFFRHLGEQAADAMMAKLASGPSASEMGIDLDKKSFGEKMKDLAGKGKDLATKGKDAVVGAAEKHPRTAKGLGAAAGLAAVGGAAAAGYKHFKKKDSEGPASEEKKAFDLLAAQTAMAFVKQAKDQGATVDLQVAVNDLNAVLHKLAQDGGNDESDNVKQAAAAGNGEEALNVRAAELLSLAGYTWLG